MDDRYANLDDAPGGRDGNNPIPHLQHLRQVHKVHYFFGSVDRKTDKMLRTFRDKTGKNWIEERSLANLGTMAGTILKTLNTSVLKTAASCGNAALSTHTSTVSTATSGVGADDLLAETALAPEGDLSKGMALAPTAISWTTLPQLSFKSYRGCLIEHLKTLQRSQELFTGSVRGWENYLVKVAEDPFAEGATRWAYHSTFTQDGKEIPYVLKRFKSSGSKWMAHTPDNYLEQTKASAVAAFLACQFNAKGKWKTVEYLSSYAVEIKQPLKPARNYSAEPKLPDGPFTKWCNNTGVWSWLDLKDDTLVQFSKFTYDATGGFMMVADLQGIYHEGKYQLTDPVILCKDL